MQRSSAKAKEMKNVVEGSTIANGGGCQNPGAMCVIESSFDETHLKEIFSELGPPHVKQMDFIEAQPTCPCPKDIIYNCLFKLLGFQLFRTGYNNVALRAGCHPKFFLSMS